MKKSYLLTLNLVPFETRRAALGSPGSHTHFNSDLTPPKDCQLYQEDLGIRWFFGSLTLIDPDLSIWGFSTTSTIRESEISQGSRTHRAYTKSRENYAV